MVRTNGNRFSVYTSEEKTVLGVINELAQENSQAIQEIDVINKVLEEKTDIYGDHKGTWQGLSRPTLSEEGMRSIVEDIIDNKIPSIETTLEHKAYKNEVFTMANMGQDIKEAMTGGSVAVVGEDMILTKNIVDNQVTPKKTSFIKVVNGVNKLDFNEITKGSYIKRLGEIVTHENLFYSDKIKVKKGDVIRCTLTNTYLSYPGIFVSSEGTSTKLNSIDGYYVTNETRYGLSSYKYYTVTIPDNGYIIVNGVISDLDSRFMLTINQELPLKFELYYENCLLNKNIKVEYINNSLYNKSIMTFGDSVMYGAGGSVGGFAKMIADKNNMSLINNAKSGYTICVSSDYPSRGSILKVVEESIKNNDNADYILIEGGFNDVFNKSKCPLGEISSDYITFNETTFSGALEKLFKQVLIKWYDKKILFILGHNLYRSFNDTTTPFDYWLKNQNLYWDRAIEICKKWNIPYIDMRLSGFIPLTDELLATYFAESNQSTHPNDLGYKRIYVDKIENKIMQL